mgnify:FL=1
MHGTTLTSQATNSLSDFFTFRTPCGVDYDKGNRLRPLIRLHEVCGIRTRGKIVTTIFLSTWRVYFSLNRCHTIRRFLAG